MPGVLSKRSRYSDAAAWLSAWWSNVLARISWSKSPPTIGTWLMAATGGTRRSRSGAINPRRAPACHGRAAAGAGERAEDRLPREPRVRLDRQGIAAQRLVPALDRRREAVAVPLRRQVTLELRDEEPAMREDEHAHRPRRLDEARSGDRLPGRGRMAEAVTASSAWIGARPLACTVLERVFAGFLGRLVVFVLVRKGGLVDGNGAVAVRVLLVRGDQLCEHAGERVDLMP